MHARRADNARGSDGRLLPAPQMLLNPLRISEKARNATGIAAFEARYDALMEQVRGCGCGCGCVFVLDANEARMERTWVVVKVPARQGGLYCVAQAHDSCVRHSQ
eukprot:1160025-Pelagomonas_calceolata.AAC.1